jgi:hypothetical protein
MPYHEMCKNTYFAIAALIFSDLVHFQAKYYSTGRRLEIGER